MRVLGGIVSRPVVYGSAHKKARFDAWAMLGLCIMVASACFVVFCIKY